jgi:chaperone modulatory protein CbpM
MKLSERQVLEQCDAVTLKQLRQWVHSGWIVPAQGESGLSFDDVDVARSNPPGL